MRSFVFFVLFFTPSLVLGQGAVGSWEDHLPYNSIKKIIAGEDKIFAATDYALAIYDLQFSEIQKFSTVQGLSECGIRTIGYSEDQNTLMIAYNSTNIDLYKDNIVTNIPDIHDKYIPGKKIINNYNSKWGICIYRLVALVLLSWISKSLKLMTHGNHRLQAMFLKYLI